VEFYGIVFDRNFGRELDQPFSLFRLHWDLRSGEEAHIYHKNKIVRKDIYIRAHTALPCQTRCCWRVVDFYPEC